MCEAIRNLPVQLFVKTCIRHVMETLSTLLALSVENSEGLWCFVVVVIGMNRLLSKTVDLLIISYALALM